jgi:hypothetical protein
MEQGLGDHVAFRPFEQPTNGLSEEEEKKKKKQKLMLMM